MSAIMIYVMAALNYGVRTGDVGTAWNYVLFDWPLFYVIGMICDLCTSLHHLPTIQATILIQIHASQRHGMIVWAIAMLQPLGLVEREFRTEKLVNAHSIAIKKAIATQLIQRRSSRMTVAQIDANSRSFVFKYCLNASRIPRISRLRISTLRHQTILVHQIGKHLSPTTIIIGTVGVEVRGILF